MCHSEDGLECKGIGAGTGLGANKTAWLMLQKLRQAMVRIGRDTLDGERGSRRAYVGGEEAGVAGRQVGRERPRSDCGRLDGKKVGRIRLRHVPYASARVWLGS